MKSTSSLLAYPQLIAEIRRLSQEGQSGTIFITSDDGHLVRIVLDDGRITFLAFDTNYRSHDAIPLINMIKFGQLHFSEGIFETVQEAPLPNTLELFQMFSNQTHVDTPKQLSSLNLREAIEHIKTALAAYIGPIALIVCEEYIDKVGSLNTMDNIVTMIDVVASEIECSDEREAFKARIQTKIKTLE
ncbi:MAG: hypothetical protein ABFS56_20565 [Pseudomonadota bacterium]